MPNDILRWEEGGALVHHCPQCQTPLTNPRSQKRCLGDHVEWCRNYHFQLFKKGGSIQCMACRNSDEQQDKRCRHIGELIRQLREISSDETEPTPRTPLADQFRTTSLDGSATKKDRKDAKKAAKAAARPRIITSKDVKRIGDILNPPTEDKEEDFEKALMKDEDIKMNVYYHRGTANTHEMRHRFIAQHRAGQVELDIQKAEMDRIMAELKVPDAAVAKTKAERNLIGQIQNAVKEDLVHVHGEERQTMQRKAGFWRWANNKAFERLKEHGRIWDWKVDQVVPAKVIPLDQIIDVEDDEGLAEDDPVVPGPVITEGISLRSNVVISEPFRNGPASTPSASRNTSASSASRTTRTSISTNDEDDGWSTVGKVKPVSKPFQLKLVSNSGLGHLTTSPSPRSPKTPKASGAVFTMLSTAEESEAGYDSGDEYSPISPCTTSKRSPLFDRSAGESVPVEQMRRLQMTPRM